ncbi:D-alanyl-D-alanine carboxypeptidase DacB [Polycladomyces abyssicola]|uniref:serine-type D-Ala-D-Ala carboxypeptidase n=1 Tax=Polycladomyces abyssicola TaxID=1125966 RepID=A0A8D5ZN89_9BACL|nr:D-alanyl-D-alanine carboxypeptidase family protein [Polycladomyces abyssicola]BCU81707.1 D-alanyl-D-alanine carboxypeptidase DacB [Polycladomyces abyssicola]
MRHLKGGAMILCLIIGLISSLGWGWGSTEPQVSAHAAAMIDVQSGRLLYAKHADERLPIASLTKIMTAIVAIENSRLTDKVTVPPEAVGVEGSSIYLKAEERISMGDLLYGLMLRSGNDAAVTIARHVGGSVEGFVYMMNEKAAYLGLENTHFANPHGLDAPEHYSSAADLARLTAYALKNPTFREIVRTQVKTVPWPGEEWHRKWYNKNKMLRFYKGADGVKTGYTKKARRTLVSSATRNGRQLVTVTLNAPDDWNDSMQLLEYGFQHFHPVKVVKKGQAFQTVRGEKKGELVLRVVAEQPFIYPLTEEERHQVSIEPVLSYPLKKMDREGLRVGTARVLLNGQPVGTVPLVTQYQDEPSVFSEWMDVFQDVLGMGVGGGG